MNWRLPFPISVLPILMALLVLDSIFPTVSSNNIQSFYNTDMRKCPDCLVPEFVGREIRDADRDYRVRNRRAADCRMEREERRKPRSLSADYIPVCRKDGSWASLQCHRPTRTCWCVNSFGQVMGSIFQYGNTKSRFSCYKSEKKMVKSPAKRNSKRKKSCSPSERAKFNEAMLNTFKSEFNRMKTITKSLSDLDGNKSEVVLGWKFDYLDKNKDNLLRRKETRDFKRLIKQHIKPQNCAQSFIRYCTKNDKIISKKEWIDCLKIAPPRPPSSLPPDIETGLRPSYYSRVEAPSENSTCFMDRQSALNSQKLHSNVTIIPDCTSNGLYKHTQCAQGVELICWCVYEDTGVQIPNTLVFNTSPNCEKNILAKFIKGCTGTKKRDFLIELMKILENKVRQSTPKNSLEGEQVARWHFIRLDSNSNGILERREWKIFKVEISADKRLKRCGKKLPRACDVNQDMKISLGEWLDCLGAKSNLNSTESPRPGNKSGRRSGKNPFTNILKQ